METNEQMVPLARLNEKNDRIKALEKQLAEQQMTLKDAQSEAKAAAKWKTRFESERDNHEATRKGYDERLTLIGAGITDEADQQLARWKYGQLEGDDRPSLAEYLGGAALEDKHLASILAAPSSEPVQTAAPSEEPAAPAPASAPEVPENTGVQPTTQYPNDLATKILNASPEEYEAMRGEVLGMAGGLGGVLG